jgi:predicted RNase H-like HicB family nuclease
MGSEREQFRIHSEVYFLREDDGWAAVAKDYSVVGVGQTRERAVENLTEALGAYLQACAYDGLDVRTVKRPISRSWKLRLDARVAAARVRSFFSGPRHPPEASAQVRDTNLEPHGMLVTPC